jgi:formylglycine-generating enzyme required for sulfatase activity
MRHLWLLAVCAAALLCVSCGEDDCYYCGKDISGGMMPDKDVPVIPKETDKPQPDNATVPDDGGTPDEQSDESSDTDLLPTENMVLIEAATFMMGCEDGADPNCADTNATPRHEVTVSGFEIDIHEVTKKEYEACITAGVCVNDSDNDVFLYNVNDGNNPYCILLSSLNDSLPANCITWEGARVYCEWVDKRLPSEAEWELAARGTDELLYPWGDTPPPSCETTVMEGANDWGCDTGGAMPVGSKPYGASPYGLYDMAGNVWEWVEDDWHDSYNEPNRPDNGTAWVEDPRTPNRVNRGSSFMIGSDEFYQFLTYAHYAYPMDDAAISRGFRCAR